MIRNTICTDEPACTDEPTCAVAHRRTNEPTLHRRADVYRPANAHRRADATDELTGTEHRNIDAGADQPTQR